jgi:intein-encoded DNA endonuclease-like protein
MAYVLGFFAADGYITINKHGGHYFCIQITDEKLLFEIKKIMKAEHKISCRKMRANEKLLYRIQIGNTVLCEDLRNLGFVDKKTKNMLVPEIPKKYLFSFVRGYFDGDGNVWSGWVHKGRNTQTISIQTVFTSCSIAFLEVLRDKLVTVGIEKGVISKTKKNAHRLTYSVFGSLKLYKFMYNRFGSSKLFLPRKKVVFERYIKMRP